MPPGPRARAARGRPTAWKRARWSASSSTCVATGTTRCGRSTSPARPQPLRPRPCSPRRAMVVRSGRGEVGAPWTCCRCCARGGSATGASRCTRRRCGDRTARAAGRPDEALAMLDDVVASLTHDLAGRLVPRPHQAVRAGRWRRSSGGRCRRPGGASGLRSSRVARRSSPTGGPAPSAVCRRGASSGSRGRRGWPGWRPNGPGCAGSPAVTRPAEDELVALWQARGRRHSATATSSSRLGRRARFAAVLRAAGRRREAAAEAELARAGRPATCGAEPLLAEIRALGLTRAAVARRSAAAAGPDQPRARRPGAGRRGPDKPPDCRPALHQREDGQRARLEHPGQARGRQPDRGRRPGPPRGPAQPDRRRP